MEGTEQQKKTKILRLLHILQRETDDHHGMSMSDILRALSEEGIESERKSIYGDIEALSDLGYTIEKQGSGKSTTYHLVERTFELAELKQLVDAVGFFKYLPENKRLRIIEKLTKLASRHEAASLKREVYVADRRLPANPEILYSVDTIHTAMEHNRQISFLYYHYNERKEKQYHHEKKAVVVSPWLLVMNDGFYYLVAYLAHTASFRHYRIDRMEKVTETEMTRYGKDEARELDPISYAKKTFGMFHGDDELVNFRADNSLSSVVIDRFGDNLTFFPCDDNHFTFSAHVAVSPQFFGWVMSFGEQLIITGPEKIRSAYRALAEEVLSATAPNHPASSISHGSDR